MVKPCPYSANIMNWILSPSQNMRTPLVKEYQIPSMEYPFGCDILCDLFISLLYFMNSPHAPSIVACQYNTPTIMQIRRLNNGSSHCFLLKAPFASLVECSNGNLTFTVPIAQSSYDRATELWCTLGHKFRMITQSGFSGPRS